MGGQLRFSKRACKGQQRRKIERAAINFSKMTKIPEASKQLTLDRLPAMPDNVATNRLRRNAEKQIVITEISAITKDR